MITMENSSVPFRAFLGAILSVVKGKAVEASVFNREMELDTINEEEEEESPSTPDADDGSGKYKGPGKEPIGSGPATRSGDRTAASSKKATLMARTFYAPFYFNGLSEIHLDRCHHLRPNLLNHFRFGSVSILSQTTSLAFRQLSIMANNVCG